MNTPAALYLGMMSGTSADGVDVVCVEFLAEGIQIHAHHSLRYPPELRHQVLEACATRSTDPETLWRLDAELGELYAECVAQLLAQHPGLKPRIRAIGCHGQTIRHRPGQAHAFTVQIGDAARLAIASGLPVVADVRRADMALGGQGAPLAPALHQALFASAEEARAVVNIGGMANLTDLTGEITKGFDTGPGNALMDAHIQRYFSDRPYDEGGTWAQSGHACPTLLERLLEHPFFAAPPPKSTGREDFHLDWVYGHARALPALPPQDIQATLCELTCVSIEQALTHTAQATERLLVCGGGAYNTYLMQRLAQRLGIAVEPTEALGLGAQWVEACLMAWLARQRLAGQPGNLPSVTGAHRACVLGALHLP